MPKRTRSPRTPDKSAPPVAAASVAADTEPLSPVPDALTLPDRSDQLRAIGLSVLVVVILLLMRPLIDIPRNDDFSYARTAEVFARTGRIVYNAWGSPMILPQSLVGAIIIRVFGFSYAALSVLGVVTAGVAAYLMYRLARVCGASPSLATLATVVLTLNPIYLSVAPSFMTDIPSLVLYLGALLALVTALGPETESGRSRVVLENYGRFALSVALGALAGANRQILWAAYIVAVLAVALYAARRSRVPLVAGGALVLAVAGGLMLWMGKQPYTVPAGIAPGLEMMRQFPHVVFMFTYKFLNMMGLFLFPVLLGATWGRRRSLRWLLLSALLLFCLLPLHFHFFTRDMMLLRDRYYLTVYGQYFTSSGAMVGGPHGFVDRPVVMTPPVIAFLAYIGAAGLTLSVYLFLTWWEPAPSPQPKGTGTKADAALPPPASPPDGVARVGATAAALGSAVQVVISIPWYGALNVFDRYLLLLLPGFLCLHAAQASRAVEGSGRGAGVARVVSCVSGAFAALIAVVGIMFAGEYVQYTRARAILFERLTGDKKIARQNIDGGFEINADTQVLAKGYVNNEAMSPREAYRPDLRGRLISYRPEVFPEVDARYVISIDPAPDASLMDPEPVDRIEYFSPLPPSPRTMYVYRLREDAVLPQ